MHPFACTVRPQYLWLLDPKAVKDYSQIVNPECGVWHDSDFSSVEFQALTENNVEFTQPNQPKHLQVHIGSYGEFQVLGSCDNLSFML